MSSVESHHSHPSEIYLDNNATTKVLPVVVDAVIHAMQTCYGNPSSSHITGIQAKNILESTRELACETIGGGNGEIIFTSGATEGIQMAIVCALVTIKKRAAALQGGYLLYGATEHKAVPNTLQHWNEVLGVNAEVLAIPVDDKGLLDEAFITAHIDKCLMICTMAVNNETGVRQDLAKLEQLIRRGNEAVMWLVDCVQTLGKMRLHLSQTSINYAVFSGHKVYTPKGIGLLYVREGSPCIPFIAGGGQESGARSGTENIPGIAALKKVFSLLLDPLDDTFKSTAQLVGFRDQIVDTLKQVFPAIVFNHDFAHSVPTTINFAVPGMFSKDLMDLFDAASIRVSSGSACSAKVTRSFVLDAMGLEPWRSESAIRMSLGAATTQEEVSQACEGIKSIMPALKHACLRLSDLPGGGEGQLNSGFIELFYNNCCCWLYIDIEAKACIVIDPLPQFSERIEKLISCQNLTVQAVIDTHLHADHSPCHDSFSDFVLGNIAADLRDTNDNGWPLHCDKTTTLADGQTVPSLSVGALQVVAVETPGHSPDSISLLFIDQANTIVLALAGDLIMPGGLGRTDLAGGDTQACYHSLKKLAGLLTPDTLIGSSHDYQHRFVTTLNCERCDNALLDNVLSGVIGAADFDPIKASVDRQLVEGNGGIQCGYLPAVDGTATLKQPFSLTGNEIDAFLQQQPTAIIVDVREAYESEVGDLSHQLHFSGQLIPSVQLLNVPLTQFADFVSRGYGYKQTPLLLICRSGTRSLLAGQSLLRLGFEQVYNIRGGLALA